MKLKHLLEKTDFTLLSGSLETEISTLEYDSRKVQKGSVFVCISGTEKDAHAFIPEALKKGASALVVEREEKVSADITVVRVDDSRRALACMSAAYFGYPARKLKTIAITGTKGKTTTAYMIREILEAAGIRTGLIGTIETIIGDERIPSENTTPESWLIHESFARMADAGLEAVVMEASSQALKLQRLYGIVFDIGVFTNLQPDHIGPNEHQDFAEYLYCKSLLFRQCRLGILNGDSRYLEEILAGHTCETETFGCGEACGWKASGEELFREDGALGVRFQIQGKQSFEVKVHVPGKFSVYNSLAAAAVCSHFGVGQTVIQKALRGVRVKGRIERIPEIRSYTLLIDYAHNAMSLESLLTTLRAYRPKRLICLFGCGGNRAKARRYEMGEVSSRLADLTVVTSDNPRNEEPEAIIDDILSGVRKAGGAYVSIPDRKEAIAYCMLHAQEGDLIVLAGKGHEDYQEIGGVRHPMDERKLVAEIIRENPGLLL